MSRPLMTRSRDCVTCQAYVADMPFEERQKIAMHRMEHQRIDRRRERNRRHDGKPIRRKLLCPGPNCLTRTPGGRLCHYCRRTAAMAA